MNFRPKIVTLIASIATVTCAMFSIAVPASPTSPNKLQLSGVPLFLSDLVQSNLVVTLDDSGSMASGFMPATADNDCGWRYPQFYSSSFNSIYYDPNVVYTPPVGPDGKPFPDAVFDAAYVDGISHYLFRNYNYGADNTSVVKLSENYYPIYMFKNTYGQPAYDQTQNTAYLQTWSSSKPHIMQIFPNSDSNLAGKDACTSTSGDLPPADARQLTAPVSVLHAVQDLSQPNILSWHVPAFYYTPQAPVRGQPQGYDYHKVGDAGVVNGVDEKTNFANWFSYYNTRSKFVRTTIGQVFASSTGNFRVAWQNLNWPSHGSADWRVQLDPAHTQLGTFSGTTKTNFFKWLYAHATDNLTPTRAALYRVGKLFQQNSHDIYDPYYDTTQGIELTCRQNYHLLVTDGQWNDPDQLRRPVFGAGGQTNGAADPTGGVQPESKPIILPDGVPYSPSDTETAVYWNEVPQGTSKTDWSGQCGTPVCLPTLADLAFYYWATNLRPDFQANNTPILNVPQRWKNLQTGLIDNIPAPATGLEAIQQAKKGKGYSEAYFNPANDPASWPHLVNYIVGLGLSISSRTHPNPPSVTDLTALRQGSMRWPEAIGYSTSAIQDTWHAAVNSRGDYFLASNTQDLQKQLNQVLYAVNSTRGSTASATVSSGVASSGTLAYKAGFDTTDWSGFVEAYTLNPDGTTSSTPVWSAQTKLNSRNDPTLPTKRIIFTTNLDTGVGAPFEWNSIGNLYTAALYDQPWLNYIRGDFSNEADQPGTGHNFRIRGKTLLGAIVNSGVVMVAGPSADYDDAKFPAGSAEATDPNGGYAAFRNTYKHRARRIIAGANDGMLHAFDDNGNEKWAYIPAILAAKLPLLADQTSGYQPFVNNTPTVRDVYLNGKGWRTVLVGTLRDGGQGVFALDITNASPGSEQEAAGMVLWEFSDKSPGGQNLGYTYGKANIARLASGEWVALVPGGYGSEQQRILDTSMNDGSTGDGRAALFVINLATGKLIQKIDMTEDPDAYGLSFATTGSYDVNSYVDQFAVAGDLKGNVWRITLGSDWKATRIFAPSTSTAWKQSVTAAPRIFQDPSSGGLLVLFGTGRLLGQTSSDNGTSWNDDLRDTNVQTLYAIPEPGQGPNASAGYPIAPDSSLLAQRTLSRPYAGANYFVVSGDKLQSNQRGWRVDFPDLGERMINGATALFSQGIAIVETVIPNGGDPCNGGTKGNLYMLDAATGLAPSGGPFIDTNGDHKIGAGDDPNAVGVSLTSGTTEGSVSVLVPPGGGVGTVVGTGAGLQVPGATWRRRNWRELIK